LKHFILIIGLFFISYCSDKATAPENEDNGTQFPARGTYGGTYWPTDQWRSCAPEEVNMDSALLMSAYEYASDPDFETYSILIIKDGYIVGEAYFNEAKINSTLQGYSFAKIFTNAAVGVAIDQGVFNSVDDFIYTYLPAWNKETTPEIKKRVKIRHLLSMTGGLDWNYDPVIVDDYVMQSYEDYMSYVLIKHVIYEPGTHWNYSNGEAMMISGIMESNLKMHVNDYTNQNIFSKIGLPLLDWSSDDLRQTNTAYGIWATTRQYARMGYLYLKKGRWEQEQIMPEEWVIQSTNPISDEFNHYGFYWWLPPGFQNYDQYDIPDSTYIAVGANGQRMYIVPEYNLVVLRMGQGTGTEDKSWDTMKFLELILNAVKQ